MKEVIISGTRPMEAYGGVSIDENVLEEMVERLRSGEIGMNWNHDVTQPFDATFLAAELRVADDGHKDVWLTFEIDGDEWQTWVQHLESIGAPGGFSWSGSQPFTTLEALPTVADPVAFQLAADAHFWNDDDLLAAGKELQEVGSVALGRRFAFSHVPDAVVVLSFVLNDPISAGLITSAIWDALKKFLWPGGAKTIYHFEAERSDVVVRARLETNDPDVAKEAIAELGQLAAADQRGPAFWDGGQWNWP